MRTRGGQKSVCVTIKTPPSTTSHLASEDPLADSSKLVQKADLKRLYALSMDMLCIATMDGYFQNVNPAFVRTLGNTEEELISRPFMEFVHPDDRAATIKEVEQLSRGVATIDFENRYLCADGEYKWLFWSAAPEPDSNLIYASARDMTKQKELEQHMNHAQRLEMLGTLAAGIAHDLNNILSPLLAVSELLKIKYPNADQQALALFHLLNTNAEHGMNLVQQILAFAAGDSGERVEVKLEKIVDEIHRAFDKSENRSVELNVVLGDALRSISGDPTQIFQILLNLCINARDAMPEGGTIELSMNNIHLAEENFELPEGAGPGPYVVIEVTDSGVGILPAHKDKIFEPFFSTRREHGGTGLGLATVAKIVSKHKGIVKLKSLAGQTRFSIYLPAYVSS